MGKIILNGVKYSSSAKDSDTVDGKHASDFVNKAGDSMIGDLGITYAPPNVSDGTPVIGGVILCDNLIELKNYRGFLGTCSPDGNSNWNNVISSRHRNGHSDGQNYGMYLRCPIVANEDDINLYWRTQNTDWHDERVLLDSYNYKKYCLCLPLSGGHMKEDSKIQFQCNGGISGGINISTKNGAYSSSYFPSYLHFEAKDIEDEYYDNWSIDIGAKDGIVITSTGNDYDDKTIIKEGYARFVDNTSGDDTVYSSKGILQNQTSLYIATKDSRIDLCSDALYPSRSIISSTDTPYIDLGKASSKWRNIYATNGIIQTSDKAKKTDIKKLDIKLIKAFVMGLIPCSYKMVDGTSGRIHHGFIAQDIEELLNDIGLTSYDFAGFIKSPKKNIRYKDENGNKLKKPVEEIVKGEYDYALRYDEFIALLTKMIQEQQKEIEKIKKSLMA